MKPSAFPGAATLLIQARSEQDMVLQEQECFAERTRLRPSQIRSFNVITNPMDACSRDGIDILFIGGAGEFSAAGDYEWMAPLLEFVSGACTSGIPVFGSCWGHQLIARAMGGRVEHDPARAEMGCLPVSLTSAGSHDPLFTSFPNTFLANMGHHDRVTVLPPVAIELARSESQPNQAFKLAGFPVYGTQFHSELDARRERERLIRYRPYYLEEMPDDSALQAIIDNLAETTEVDHLLHDFIRLFLQRA